MNRVLAASWALAFGVVAMNAQVCRMSVAGLNRNRKVVGAIHSECPISIHTPPFGNWGVTSNFGQKVDGRQFEGWCHDTRICDNNGNCSVQCRDNWYEWNSCTDIPQYQPPNTTLYNAMNGTEQVTVTGNNVHGTITVDVPVRCPADTNGDNSADSGGCGDVRTHSSGVNFMSLYEIDPGTTDDLVQTVYFPEIVLPTGCKTWNCAPIASNWVAPNGYDSPRTPAKVYAEVAMLINSGTFIDNNRSCRLPAFRSETVSAASFVRAPVAPESIASVFGEGLATGTAAAQARPLPTTLGGSTVSVVDAAGVSRPAGLFYASPDQINYQVPPGTAPGHTRVVVTREDGIRSEATVSAASTAPGIFTANANGTGVPAAVALKISAAGAQILVPVFTCGSSPGSCIPAPINFGAPSDELYLTLFGTGLRFHSGLASVQALIGGQNAPVLYAGPQGEFVGLDQVNIRLPRSLSGRGEVAVLLSVGGLVANIVTIVLQ